MRYRKFDIVIQSTFDTISNTIIRLSCSHKFKHWAEALGRRDHQLAFIYTRYVRSNILKFQHSKTYCCEGEISNLRPSSDRLTQLHWNMQQQQQRLVPCIVSTANRSFYSHSLHAYDTAVHTQQQCPVSSTEKSTTFKDIAVPVLGTRHFELKWSVPASGLQKVLLYRSRTGIAVLL